MVIKEVLSALEVLTSDVPLHCQAWPDSRTFEVLSMDYFTRNDDYSEESETSDCDHNGISTSFSTFKLYTGFSIDGEENESQFSNNAGMEWVNAMILKILLNATLVSKYSKLFVST